MSFSCVGAAPFFASMIAEINKWIENGSRYQEGILLYEKFGSDNFLKLLFSRGEKELTKKMLNEALLKLLSSGPDQDDQQLPQENQAPTPAQEEPKPTAYQSTQPSANPPELLKVISQINSTYAEIRGLHPFLSTLPEGEELRALAENISRMGKKNAELWQRRNFINEHGHDFIDTEPLKPVMVDLNLITAREQIRKSLNKAENRIKKQNPKNANTIALINERKKELAEMDLKIAEAKERGLHA